MSLKSNVYSTVIIVVVTVLTLGFGCGKAESVATLTATPVSSTATEMPESMIVPAAPTPVLPTQPSPTVTSPLSTATPTPTEMEATPLSAAAPEPTGPTLDVPQGNPITLDGTLSADEWAGARRVELSSGGELLLMHDQGYLYLGLRATANPLGSICLDRDDEVAVLHSSAALGTAVYRQGERDWQKIKDFGWSCRDTSNTSQARRGRDEHLQAEGWVASNGHMGTPEEMEYQIAVPNDSLRLAVTNLQAPYYNSVLSWPEQLDDGCATLELLTGPVPDHLTFAPETWMTLNLKPKNLKIETLTATSDQPPTEPNPDLRITIVYDNTTYDERLKPEWGFAAWVEYGEHTLLFDTGGNGATLLNNVDKLGLDPQLIKVVVLSHEHGDHTGGLTSLLRRGNRPTVYVPASFSASFKHSIGALTDLVEVTEPVEIWPGIHTTGEIHGGITEQGLMIETEQGLVLITGCAHPGIVNMVRQARRVVDDEVALVVGGFHLGRASQSQVECIIADFRALGVKQVCPTHCTGDEAIATFAQAYGDDYVQGGVGRVITFGFTSPSGPAATSTPTTSPTPTPTPLPGSVLLEPMNYQRQTHNNCGPTSVAILLGYYGHQVTQHDVNQYIAAGSVEDLLDYLPQFELTARAYRSPPSREAVRHLLANRIPVIVNQWLSTDSDIRHYRVIKGYDDVSREFITDDPLQGADLRIGYADFMRLSMPGEVIPVYPPELDPFVQSLMQSLWMHECPI